MSWPPPVLELKIKTRMDEIYGADYKQAARPGHLKCGARFMARVLYGVMGNTYGHVARTLAIVTRLPEHEFYFVGGGRAREWLGKNHPVLEVPVKRTVHENQRVSVAATCAQLARCTAQLPRIRRRILNLIEEWQPDLAICDREIFLPHAARAAGLECVGLDHSHVVSACRYPVPASQRIPHSLARLEDSFFFNYTKRNLIVSFFHPALKRNGANELFPPVLRPEVREFSAKAGKHVLIYQTSPTFKQLIEAARQIPRPVIIYGFRDKTVVEGNLTFKPFDARQILADLASCAYAVVNGGHNLICEALYYHKPVLCFPITGQFEQFINAWHVRELGYGDFSTSRVLTAVLFHHFETHLAEYRQNIRAKFVDGTDAVVARVRALIEAASKGRA
jgi:uncharacterized protein (TIGR00661 family)